VNFNLNKLPYHSAAPVALTLLAGLSLWMPLPPALKLMAAAALAFVLPGWALLRATRLAAFNWLEHLALAVGLSFGLTTLAALGVLYATGSLPVVALVALLGGITLSLAAIDVARGGVYPATEPVAGRTALFCLIPVLAAAFFSLTNLGYSDYWGDEMNGLLRAVSIISGRPETIFEHTKGPVEVLIPAVFGLLAGRFEPFTLRLPFALAHIVGIAGFFLLGLRLFGRNTALIASLLLAVNGLYLAFGRIVQYQAVVFLMTGLMLLLTHHFYREGGVKKLALAALLAAAGLLAHYDLLLALPPVLYGVWRYYARQKASALKNDLLPLSAAVVIFVAAAAAFYAPFLLNPHVAKTSSYLNRIIGAANWPANNFDQLYTFGVMYNSRLYMALIALLGLGVIVADLAQLARHRRPGRWFWAVTAGLLALLLAAPATGWINAAPLLVFTLLFTWLVFFTPANLETRLVYVWVGVSFIGYVFFIDHPRTHLQIIYPGWSLLAALALTRPGAAIARRIDSAAGRRWAAAGAAAMLAGLFCFLAYYEYLLFVDAEAEYILTYPAHKNSLYQEDPGFPFGSRRLYGAPHRLGWQMVNQLFLQGRLNGDWGSNDDGSNLFWYTLGQPRTPCYPRYYFKAAFQQKGDEDDDTAPEQDMLGRGYAPIGQIYNRDRLQIEVFEFAPLGVTTAPETWREPQNYPSFVTVGDFKSWPYQKNAPVIGQPLPAPQPVFRLGPENLQQIAARYNDPRIVQVNDQVTLAGYNLDTTWAKPGGAVVLTLYWQPAQNVNLPYKIFTHLSDSAGQLLAQSDELPNCGASPTQKWRAGQIIADRHLLPLPANLPPGEYAINVGLYEPQTGLPMDRLDALGNPQGTSLELGRVQLPAN